ncbi:MAG: hypothetical protein ACYC8V_10200 [Caulobacteraceae bacterium]
MPFLTVGLAGLSIALASATAALSQAAAVATPAAPAAPATASAAPAKVSVELTTIGDLLANPPAKAVLAKDYPELLAYPGLDDIKGMTLRDISKYPEAKLDDARLASLQKDFDAAPK